MKKARSKALKGEIRRIIQTYPEAKLVKNRLKLLRLALTDFYPVITGSVSKDTLELFLREALYCDRMIRRETEGQDTFEKKVLSQQFVVDEIM